MWMLFHFLAMAFVLDCSGMMIQTIDVFDLWLRIAFNLHEFVPGSFG